MRPEALWFRVVHPWVGACVHARGGTRDRLAVFKLVTWARTLSGFRSLWSQQKRTRFIFLSHLTLLLLNVPLKRREYFLRRNVHVSCLDELLYQSRLTNAGPRRRICPYVKHRSQHANWSELNYSRPSYTKRWGSPCALVSQPTSYWLATDSIHCSELDRLVLNTDGTVNSHGDSPVAIWSQCDVNVLIWKLHVQNWTSVRFTDVNVRLDWEHVHGTLSKLNWIELNWPEKSWPSFTSHSLLCVTYRIV